VKVEKWVVFVVKTGAGEITVFNSNSGARKYADKVARGGGTAEVIPRTVKP
jgi:hypothetical protein